MESSFWFDTMNLGGSLYIYYIIFISLNMILGLANNFDPDEMLHHAAFHLGLHCLSKHLFAGIQNEKG